MIGKNFTYNGQAIATTTVDFRVGITVANWKSLDVSDEQQNVQGFHGVKLSPTFARGRRITLEGIIVADDHEASSKGIDYLEELFALQGIPSQVELLPFTVTDEQDRVWSINAKIKEPLSIEINDDDYLQGANRRWRVVLQAEDPRYYNTVEESTSGAEWNYGGAKLGFKLWVQLNEQYNEIQVMTGGNIETPLKFTITALNTINAPLTISNLTDGSFFALNTSAVAGDVIVIDAKTRTATKNGVNVLADRVGGSTWQKLKGTAVYTIKDFEGGLYGSDFDYTISWKTVLL